MYHGTADWRFDQEKTFKLYSKLFKKLGLTIAESSIEKDLGHDLSKKGLTKFLKFMWQ